MPKAKQLQPKTLARVVAAAETGMSQREIMRRYPNAPERLIRAIARCGVSSDEWRQIQADEYRAIASELVASVREDLRAGRISPNSKMIMAGIATDKVAELTAMNALESMSIDVLVNGYHGRKTREQMIASLTDPGFLAINADTRDQLRGTAPMALPAPDPLQDVGSGNNITTTA